MADEPKNPVPFNPHLTLTGCQQRDALDALRHIFQCIENDLSDNGVTNAVYQAYLELDRKFKSDR